MASAMRGCSTPEKPTSAIVVHEPCVSHVTFQAVEAVIPNPSDVSEHVGEAVRNEGQVAAVGARPIDCIRTLGYAHLAAGALCNA